MIWLACVLLCLVAGLFCDLCWFALVCCDCWMFIWMLICLFWWRLPGCLLDLCFLLINVCVLLIVCCLLIWCCVCCLNCLIFV